MRRRSIAREPSRGTWVRLGPSYLNVRAGGDAHRVLAGTDQENTNVPLVSSALMSCRSTAVKTIQVINSSSSQRYQPDGSNCIPVMPTSPRLAVPTLTHTLASSLSHSQSSPLALGF